jgi:cytochrome c oxidase subunit 2
MKSKFFITIWALFIVMLGGERAFADYPRPWQLGFQEAASPVMEKLAVFNDQLNILITIICIFVLLLLVYTCLRFRKSKNPVPSKTSHNTLIEIIWTVLPVVILVIIAVPSFKILYYMDKTDKPEMTLKVVGHQWYWEYQYPDAGGFSFDSNMIKDSDIKPGQFRLLEVNNRVVLPIDTNIQLLITGADVIHSWAMPSMGIKTDAVPGRTNEAWVRITKPGIYYGQCSELCGVDHAFMPIAIEAVTKEQYKQWLITAKKKFAAGNLGTINNYASN